MKNPTLFNCFLRVFLIKSLKKRINLQNQNQIKLKFIIMLHLSKREIFLGDMLLLKRKILTRK